jgi:hypothetical protein
MTTRPVRWFLLASAMLAAAATARAQGTLSTQGFGYPTSGMSTRSLGAGGAITELDPLSATNPAALPSIGGGALYVQMEPEFRRLDVGPGSNNARIARHPLATVAFPVRANVMAGLTLSNMLDRSFETNERRAEVVGAETLQSTNFFKSDGAIGDVRFALAWTPRSWDQGRRRRPRDHGGQPAPEHAAVRRQRTIRRHLRHDHGHVRRHGALRGRDAVHQEHGRAVRIVPKGGAMTVKHADTTLAKANVPDRMSFSVAFLGIRGTTIAARTSKETWSTCRGWDPPRCRSATAGIRASAPTCSGPVGPALPSRCGRVRAGARFPSGGEQRDQGEERVVRARDGVRPKPPRTRRHGIRALRDRCPAPSICASRRGTVSAGLTVRP